MCVGVQYSESSDALDLSPQNWIYYRQFSATSCPNVCPLRQVFCPSFSSLGWSSRYRGRTFKSVFSLRSDQARVWFLQNLLQFLGNRWHFLLRFRLPDQYNVTPYESNRARFDRLNAKRGWETKYRKYNLT